MSADLAISIRNLEVAFPGLIRTVRAVRGVDLDLHRGDVLGIVGESGCGKSMTASAILGMTPKNSVVTGSVKVGDQEVVDQSDAILDRIRGRRVAMIFQNPMKALNPFFTVGRQLTDFIRLHRDVDEKNARKIALDGFADVNMPDPEHSLRKYPHQMSGGQLQRVMIALALTCQPEVLIADEPTTALDVTVQAQIVMLMRELATKRGLSIIFITHDLGLVASVCNRVMVMYAGQVVESGPVEALFKAPRHPYTQKLLNMIPVVGRGKAPLQTIPGRVPDLAFPPTGCSFAERCEHASEICGNRQPDADLDESGYFYTCHHPVNSEQGDIR